MKINFLSFYQSILFSIILGQLFPVDALAVSVVESPSPNPVAKIAPPPSANANRKVLIIYSYHDTLPWQAALRNALFKRLEETPADKRPEIFEERFEAHRLSPIISNRNFLALLEAKYSKVKLDLIIAENDYAYEFLNEFPNVFPGVKRQFISYSIGDENKGLVIKDNLSEAVNIILRVLPNTKRVIFIVQDQRFIEKQESDAKQKAVELGKRNIQLEIWNDFSFAELYQNVAKLPKDTVILYFPVSVDRLGETQIPRNVFLQLYKVSPVPIFIHYDSFLGLGAVGGYMVSAAKIGNLVAKAAIGEPLPTTRAEIDGATKGYYFDDNELKRWHIPDKNLPPDSVIINREISDWYKYRWQIAGAMIAFIIESTLILALLRNLRLRKEVTLALKQERDLLDLRVAERTQELEKSRNLAEAASHAKSEFLANMSHEIRTPMNAILGFSTILSDLITDKLQRYYLDAIQASGKTLLQLINDILDLSKVEAGKLELHYHPVEIRSIFTDIEMIFQQKLLEKGIHFQLYIFESLPEYLLIDEIRLRQVLLNIIGNAVKFTDSGSIVVNVTTENITVQHLDLTISVTDTGMGIAENQREAIFSAFTQQQHQSVRYGGTGLGLTICKRLIEAMGGSIRVQSQVGQGSCFTVYLPNIQICQQPKPLLSKKHSIPLKNFHFQPATLLIVDDVESNRELVKSYLRDYSELTLLEAENGIQTLELIQKYPIDLILMDKRLPGEDGDDVCKRIRTLPNYEKVPIIMITASALMLSVEETPFYNIRLNKPLNKSQLLNAMQDLLETIEVVNITPAEIPTKLGLPSKEADTLTPERAQTLWEVCGMYQKTIAANAANSGFLEIDVLIDTAEQLQVIAQDYHYQPLSDWAERLKTQAELFDLSNLPKTLAEFEMLLAQIKSAFAS